MPRFCRVSIVWLFSVLCCLVSAQASVIIGNVTSSFNGVVTPEGSNFRYSYTLQSTGTFGDFIPVDVTVTQPGFITRIALPIFDADAVFGLQSPQGWTGVLTVATPGNWPYVAANDPAKDTYDVPATEFENPSHVIIWDREFFIVPFPTGTTPVLLEQVMGFSYLSAYGPGDGPVMLSQAVPGGEVSVAFDPPLPSSPNSPFYQPPTAPVPEPATATLGLLGLAALAGAMRRRR
jgi:uncharacterized protein (TIGR03382 family)